jgi:short-subunit dehydrogenase
MHYYHLALITGATSGIGKATCELFAQKGLNLIVTGRNEKELQHLQETLSKQVNVQIVQADLSVDEGRRRLIDILHAQAPDLVINNAGFGFYGGALTYPTEEQVNILEVNGRALLELTLEAARTLISLNKKGVILNIASGAAFQILPNMAVYAASKAFVSHFSQAFDFEVKNYGVRILTLCPGMVATAFQTRAGGSIEKQQTGVMTASFVAEQIWKQIEQLDPLLIIDWKYRLLTFFSFLIPKSWIAKAVERIIAKRMNLRTLIKI